MKLRAWLLIALTLTVGVQTLAADKPAAIASAHPLATEAGHEILAAGGNAFDAAVAISAALAVVEPMSSGLGGGGFWLLHRAKDGFETMLDGREKAPLAARRDMYLDNDGEVTPKLSVDGALAAAIPGTPAAIVHLAQYYGRLPLKMSLAPAIKFARSGFAVNESYRGMAEFRLNALRTSSAAAAVFLHNNEAPEIGYLIKQPDLAKTLESIAEHGVNGFYSGTVARHLVDGVRSASGIWSLDDLANYSVIERKPVRGNYHGIKITTATPPSSGGVALLTMLNILAGYKLDELPALTRTHLTIEAMRRAYRDRAEYLGDPDYIKVDVAQLTHPLYAAGLRASIRTDRVTPSASLPGQNPFIPAVGDTTHFSVLDKDGNRVAATMSINFPFGSGFMAPGTGVLLNDEMDDFSAKPGVPNVYGLVGGEANAIAPGKRPLSSMTPTFLEDKRGVAILGTPGGSRIISMVLLATLDYAAGHEPESWVTLPRYHHQFLPDAVQYEPGALSGELVTGLERMGHKLESLEQPYGNMQAVFWDRRNRTVKAASDPRGIGRAQVR
ncbi:MAG TPA: gamma-glutamyltransferase [Gammaproteobacteria bacterium]|nr:gamma-glutamyltransferase [Gammaproteobacteria bacterium]